MTTTHLQFVPHETRQEAAAKPGAFSIDREINAALRRVATLRGLPPGALARLGTGAIRVNVARNETLVAAHAHCPGIYLVTSGRLMLSVGGAAGGRKVLRLAEPGDVIGLAATLLGSATLAAVEALTDSTLVLIPREIVLDRALQDAQLAFTLATLAARQSRALAADLEAVSLQSGRERIVNYLLGNAGGVTAGASAVLLTAKKSVIASRLSVTPEYFSRTLRELISCGAIEVNGRQITIRDSARLRGARHGPD